MFRNDRQIARVNQVLLSSVGREGLDDLWTEEGPSDVAIHYFENDGGTLSGGERRMLLFTFALWHGESKNLSAAELLALDGEQLDLIGTLFRALALDADAVDDWIAEQEARMENEKD